MATLQTTHLAQILENDSGIAPGYRHYGKRSTPGEPLELPGAILKWYGLHSDDLPVPAEVDRLARAQLTAQPPAARGLGFVILHRCGRDFYFLIVGTWRCNNELWTTVLYKDG